MRVGFTLVDVFSDVPFAGNQLCVVAAPPDDLDGATMQVLAREIGFSETTYVTAVREGGYDVRIFTPVSELPFAGHPTLGTAFALARLGVVAASVVQTSTAGDVPVEVDLGAGTATMRQLPAVFGEPFDDRVAVAAAAGVEPDDLGPGPIVPVSTGIVHLMVPVAGEDALRGASREDRRCVDVCARAGVESLYLFAVRGRGDVTARMFDRSAEIGEDPATGSAAGPLGAYLAEHDGAGMPGHMTIAQGAAVGRPSSMEVDVAHDEAGWVAFVGGGVRIVGGGWFDL
ncbi:MAG: PhzF family phenazine biosynthesis protein [Actinobacteria bacterium]|nr:MAG: PhzF family phenazine biosynthesis protein [Actinomycetota bacterium]